MLTSVNVGSSDLDIKKVCCWCAEVGYKLPGVMVHTNVYQGYTLVLLYTRYTGTGTVYDTRA